MEGGRDFKGGVVAGAAGRRWRGDEEESSHGSSGGGGGGGGVELSLRLRTGAEPEDDDEAPASAPPPPRAAAEVEARRNMTIFYNGRVCAVDVTEVQARAIISMASEETMAADHRRQQLMRGDGDDGRRRRRQQDGDSSSSSSTSAAVAPRCARDRGLVRLASPSPLLAASAGVVGSPRQGGFAGRAVPVVEVDPAAPAGLSMKRSLQLFLQKRKARTAAAVAPPYAAGGGRQAQAVRR